MKLKLFSLLLLVLATQNINAESLELIKAKQFMAQLDAYQEKHSENLEIFTNYKGRENSTEAETKFYLWTVCNTVINLERAYKLIKNNPEYAQYLDGTLLPSIEENLDFHRLAAKQLDGTDAECKFN